MKNWIVAVALVFSACASAPPRPVQPADTPLIVLIVVDQMRTDYLDRGSPHFTAGLKRLTTEGAWFHEAAYPYLNTITCAGHSTISTGALPYHHGMILNAWWDRERRRSTACTSDSTVRNIGYTGKPAGGDSARALMSATFADRVHAYTGGRTVGISLKPRSAIPLVGRTPTAVVWYDDTAGWTTSTAFTDAPLPWLSEFFAANPITVDAGKTWDRMLPASEYEGPDDGPGERFPTGWTRTFPHVLSAATGFSSQWQRSPFADEYLGRMAVAAIDTLGLGRGKGTDFLAVSFSSLDLVGHQFGPASHEVQDMVLRLDRTIGALLDHLDRTVGRGRYVVALSSDHGVGSLPEQTADAGRQTGDQALTAINRALLPYLGEGKHAIHSAYTDIYLAPDAMRKIRGNRDAADAVIAALLSLPGVSSAYVAADIAKPDVRNDPDPIRRAAALNYYPGRSGDFIIVPKPGWMLSNTSATTHGTLYWHDQHVPVIFFGAGVDPGRRKDAATPADVVPTLGALAGIPFDAPDGKARLSPSGRR